MPPILTIHGDAGETAPYEHGTKLTRALQEQGATAEMAPVPQGMHGFPKETLDRLYSQHIWLLPSSVTPHECSEPAEIIRHFKFPATSAGTGISSIDPVPNRPSSPRPQQ